MLNVAFTITILDLISSVLSCYRAAVIIGTFHIFQLCPNIIRPVILPVIVLPVTLAHTFISRATEPKYRYYNPPPSQRKRKRKKTMYNKRSYNTTFTQVITSFHINQRHCSHLLCLKGEGLCKKNAKDKSYVYWAVHHLDG